MIIRKKKSICIFALLALLLCGCSLLPQPRHGVSIPIEQPINAPHQPFRVVQICLDTPPLYSSRYFYEATAAIANRIDAAVTVNQDGMAVFVTLITHNSFQNDVLSFSVPGVSADPVAPATPVPGQNPYDNAKAQKDYGNAFWSWQATLTTRHHDLAVLRAQVKQKTNTLRSLTPPFDNTGDDPWGCLADASNHLSGVTGEKYLLIASPMMATTTLQKLPTLTMSGVSVRVIWYPCTIASACQENQSFWTHELLRDGATDVHFFDPAQEEAMPVTF